MTLALDNTELTIVYDLQEQWYIPGHIMPKAYTLNKTALINGYGFQLYCFILLVLFRLLNNFYKIVL